MSRSLRCKFPIILYHGTIGKFVEGIMKNGIEEGKRINGYDGVFLDKNREYALEWADRARWYTMHDVFYDPDEDDYSDDRFTPMIIRVEIPSSDVIFLSPDFNLDMFQDRTWQMDVKWDDEKVHAVIYNRHGDDTGVDFGSRESTSIPPEWIISIEKCKGSLQRCEPFQMLKSER